MSETSAATEGAIANPAPIAGLVIGIMGIVLIVPGLVPLMEQKKVSVLTLTMGIIFAAIGAAMIATRWKGLAQTSRVPGGVETTRHLHP